MNILLAQNTTWVPTLGGASKGNRLLLEELAARGHRAVAVAPAVGLQVAVEDRSAFREALAQRGLEAEELSPGVDRFRLRGVEVRAVHEASRLPQVVAETIRELAPDRVLMSSEDTGQILLEAALEAAPQRVVYLARTTWNLPFGPEAYLSSEERSALLRRCLGSAAISRFLCGYMQRWGQLEARLLRLPVLTLGSGPFADHSAFEASGQPGDEGFVVHINPCAVKGLELLLACADALPNLSFAAVPTWGTTAEDRRALERRRNITLLEPRDSIDDIFRRCRAVLMPSLWAEAYGRTAVEAMLRGLPVLAADVGGLPEAKLGVDYLLPVRPVEGYSNRFDDRNLPIPRVPSQDPAPWIAALEDLFSTEERYRQVSESGRWAAEELRRRTRVEDFVHWLQELEPSEHWAPSTHATPEAKAPDRRVDQSPPGESPSRDSSSGERELSRDRRALLALRALRKRRQREAAEDGSAGSAGAESQARAAKRIPVLGREEPLPLSFPQRRVWFFERWERASAAFHIPLAASFHGRLVMPWLEGAITALVERHEVLRCRIFDDGEGQGVQQPREASAESCPVVDLQGLPEPLAAEEARRLGAVAARRPFDLASGRLTRLLALRLAPQEHRVLWVIHHIAADGWSLGVLLQEMALLYGASAEGASAEGASADGVLSHGASAEQLDSAARAPLPPLAVQYPDFAAWQRQRLQGEALETQLAFWRQHLEGAPPLLELPFDRPRGAVESFRGAKVPVAISRAVTLAAQGLAESVGSTLFGVVQLAFAQLLARYGAVSDLVLGTLVANRRVPQTQGLVGYFVNSLPLRVTLPSGESGESALRRLRPDLLAALDHQELPFESLVEALAPQRQLAHHPIFQVMIALQNAPVKVLTLPQLEVRPLEADRGAAHVDLFLSLGQRQQPEGDHLEGYLEYASDLFDAATVELLGRRFERLLAALVKHPGVPLAALDLLAAAERPQLLQEGGPGPARSTAPPRMLEELERRWREDPQALALASLGGAENDARWSRRRLLRAAGELALRLRRRGVMADEVVALETWRRPESIAAMLGILAAGAAWTPIDPRDPVAHRRRAVKQAKARCLVSSRRLEGEEALGLVALRAPDAGENLPSATAGSAADLPLDLLADLPTDLPRDLSAGLSEDLSAGFSEELWRPESCAADQAAYLLYTSGSTGRPKGVVVPRRCLDHYTAAARQLYDLKPSDRVLQFCSLSFDTSVEEIFPTLAAGAQLWLRSGEMLDPRRLLESVRAHDLTVLSLPTAFWHQLAALPPADLAPWPRSLRLVIIGGERARADALERWNDSLSQLTAAPPRLMNTYGPTEATVVAVGGDAEALGQGSGEVALGRPLPGTVVHVVDSRGELQPPGIPGELWIAGGGVTRGYRRQPRATAVAFRPDPFGSLGARVYATGDRARWAADGRLEFLGRVDQQVKIRGYRVEPGEVESALTALPAVDAVAVTVQGRAAEGGLWLGAHVVLAPGIEVSAEALRHALVRRLPGHLVPAAVEVLDALPTTATGKVDRKALDRKDLSPLTRITLTGDSSLGESRDGEGEGSRTPSGPMEELVAHCFQQVLGHGPVTANADFFQLGGHSLSAMQLAARLRAATGADLELRQIFEAATVEAVARRLSAALASGRAVLGDEELELRPRSSTSPDEPSSDERPPLSFAQERLWFLDQLEPGSAAYNLHSAVLLRGRLDADRLQQAFQRIVDRHEVLRTVFRARDGRPEQRVEPRLPFSLHRLDWRSDRSQGLGDEGAAEHEALLQLAAREAEIPFDLGDPPLLRATLVRLRDAGDGESAAEALGEERWAVLFVMHHIVSDGWSMALLIRELTVHYRQLGRQLGGGEVDDLPPLAVQYGDYAQWQRRRLSGEVLERELGFWRRQLGDAPEPLELPGRGAPQGELAAEDLGGGDSVWIELPAPLAQQARIFARGESATLFMVLLALFDTLLFRLSGRADLAVGVPVAHRQRPELESLIGFFVNTLVLRLEVDPAAGLEGLTAEVRDTALSAWAHQGLPFERLVAEVNPERHFGRSPLFQVMFALQDAPVQRLELPELRLEPLPVASGSARFELFLELAERPDGGVGGALHFATALYRRTQVQRMARQFQALLTSALAAPGARLDDLSWLSAAERHQLVVEWSDGAEAFLQEYPREQGFWPLLLRSVAASPEAPAAQVRHRLGEALETWSYRQLLERVETLARQLQLAATTADAPGMEGAVVPILARRGLPFLATVLAVFRCGGAYLPLDPLHPASRLAQVLETSAATTVLVGEGLESVGRQAAELVAQRGGARPTCIDLASLPQRGVEEQLPESVPARLPTEALSGPTSGPTSLAYVIFTSGSTGRPKGAMVEHRGMINHLWAKIRDLKLGAGDRVAQNASQCFDISVWQMLAPLVLGGSVVIYPDEIAHEPAKLVAAVDQDAITVLETVPSVMRLMVDAVEARAESDAELRFEALRWLVPTGEALPPELARRWQQRYPRILQVNAYGPTECSDDVSHHVVRGAVDPSAASVPIGRPVINTRLVIVDRRFHPRPVQVPGELCVGGDGVGRGYLHNPRRTAMAFVPDAFGATPGARMYRTGDWVRTLDDGTLDFLGRIDHQVKIRGFRIELGEIEATLDRQSQVAQCVVDARDDGRGGRRLVAYVVPTETAAVAAGDLAGDSAGEAAVIASLSAAVAAELPEYMVPAAFVLLSEMPLNRNGKVDRKALPEPEAAASDDDRFLEPRSDVEAAVAQIYAEVVEVERVGALDHFFHLGGHSLLATQVVARLREIFDVELPLRTLFEAPTVAELALAVEEEMMSSVEDLSEAELDALLDGDAEEMFEAVLEEVPEVAS
ncbi:MAG: amino acid adenylation domain-containing protein [Acidobacteriota bacterium]